MREGAAVGIRVVLTGDRAVLSGRAGSAFRDRLVLRFADPADYGLAGISPRLVPAEMPPGRALVGADVQEAQLAVLDAETTGAGQVRAVEAVGSAARARPPAPHAHAGLLPMRVEPLPTRVEVGEVEAAAKAVATGPGWALVGVGGDDLVPLGVDLARDGPAFVVAGPAGSGRSTTLATIGRWLLGQGRRAVVVAHRRSPLRSLGGEPGVLAVRGLRRHLRARPASRSRTRTSSCSPTTPRPCTTPRWNDRCSRCCAPTPTAGRRCCSPARPPTWSACSAASRSRPGAAGPGCCWGRWPGRRRPARRPAAPVRRAPPGRGVLVVRGRQTPVQVATTSL